MNKCDEYKNIKTYKYKNIKHNEYKNIKIQKYKNIKHKNKSFHGLISNASGLTTHL